MTDRKARIKRKTKETEVRIFLNLDGKGESKINTTYPFLDHMLSLFCYHGFFDLQIYAKGDTQVGYHHLVEDVGICLGKAVKNGLGEKKGIRRYGNCFVPMDDVLVQVALDVSGRPLLVFNFPTDSDLELAKEFFHGFSSHSGITLHINLCYGHGVHHLMEAIFKAFALSLDEATSREHRRRGVPSTKETLE
ncbi:MAG: imidazoleglycerol-phosphate dehydratase HisB [bacterium]